MCDSCGLPQCQLQVTYIVAANRFERKVINNHVFDFESESISRCCSNDEDSGFGCKYHNLIRCPIFVPALKLTFVSDSQTVSIGVKLSCRVKGKPIALSLACPLKNFFWVVIQVEVVNEIKEITSVELESIYVPLFIQDCV